MRASTRVVSFSIALLVLGACGDDAPSGPPSVVALARTSEDMPRESAELAAGLALEVGHRLSRSPDVVVRTVSTPMTSADASFAETAEQLAVDLVIWVNVTGTAEQPVVRYVLETTEGEQGSGESPLGSESDVFAAPKWIADDARSLLANLAPVATTPPEWSLSVASAGYGQFVRGLGSTHGTGANETERVAAFEQLPPELGSYPPAVVALGHAYLDLAGTLPGTGPYYDLAEETLRRAYQLDPLYPPARYLLASCLTKRGRSEEAVTLLLDGLASHPAYPPYHDQLGYVSRYAGLMEASMASYRRAQELDPSLENLVSTQDQITKSLIYLGQYRDALASHERMEGFLDALARSPDEKEWFYRGVIHLYAGEPDRAVEAFERGEELDSTSVWTVFGRAYTGIARGDREAVAEVLDALERSVVVDGERHYRLVHFAAFLAEPERALQHLEESIRSGFFNAPYFASDPLTTGLRTHVGFSRALSSAQERHDAFERTVNGPAGG